MIIKYLSFFVKLLRKLKFFRYHQCLYLHNILKKRNENISCVTTTNFKFKFNCRLEEFIEFSIFMEGLYEKRESKFVHRYIKPNFTCLDIGANTGYYSLLLSCSASKVFSLEPSVKNYECLLRNIQLNYKVNNIRAFNLGVSSKKEFKRLHISNDCCGNNSYVFGNNNGDSEITSLTTIDDFLIENEIRHVDFVKIDVEGFENEVVNGAINAIRKNILKVVLIEVKIDRIKIENFNDLFNDYNIFIFGKNGLIRSMIDHTNNFLLVSHTIYEEFLNENRDILV